MNPVSVSAYRAPAAAAILDSSVEETIVDATSRSPGSASPAVRVQQAGADQGADLVPGQHHPSAGPPFARAPGGHGQPVTVGVAGDHQVSAEPQRVGQR